jgi:hypothetical protein
MMSSGVNPASVSPVNVNVKGAVVGATVVGATVVGATVVGATVVGATVVGATVVGATVVGATVVGAAVVGAAVVGATVVGATVVGSAVEVVSQAAKPNTKSNPMISTNAFFLIVSSYVFLAVTVYPFIISLEESDFNHLEYRKIKFFAKRKKKCGRVYTFLRKSYYITNRFYIRCLD